MMTLNIKIKKKSKPFFFYEIFLLSWEDKNIIKKIIIFENFEKQPN